MLRRLTRVRRGLRPLETRVLHKAWPSSSSSRSINYGPDLLRQLIDKDVALKSPNFTQEQRESATIEPAGAGSTSFISAADIADKKKSILNTLIKTSLDAKDPWGAQEIFDHMVRREGVVPNVQVFHQLIVGFAKCSSHAKAWAWHEKMLSHISSHDSSNSPSGNSAQSKEREELYNQLLLLSIDQERLGEASYWLDLMRSINGLPEVPGDVLIDWLARAPFGVDRRSRLRSVYEIGLEINDGIYKHFFHESIKEGRLADAVGWCELMRFHDILLDAEVYGTLTTVKKGGSQAAEKLYRSGPPDPRFLDIIIAAYTERKDMKSAENLLREASDSRIAILKSVFWDNVSGAQRDGSSDAGAATATASAWKVGERSITDNESDQGGETLILKIRHTIEELMNSLDVKREDAKKKKEVTAQFDKRHLKFGWQASNVRLAVKVHRILQDFRAGRSARHALRKLNSALGKIVDNAPPYHGATLDFVLEAFILADEPERVAKVLSIMKEGRLEASMANVSLIRNRMPSLLSDWGESTVLNPPGRREEQQQQPQSYIPLMRQCFQNSDVQSCEYWLTASEREGLRLTAEHFLAIMITCDKGCDTGAAEKWLSYMEECATVKPDVKIWNSLLNAYFRKSDVLMMKDVMRRMKSAGAEPNVYTLQIWMKMFALTGDLQQAYEIIAKIKGKGMELSIEVLNAMLLVCIKTRDEEGVTFVYREFLRSSLCPDSKTIEYLHQWPSLQTEFAELLLKRTGLLKPNLASRLLQVCQKAGNEDCAGLILERAMADESLQSRYLRERVSKILSVWPRLRGTWNNLTATAAATAASLSGRNNAEQ
eukprot:jgi/Bigna1/126990/aug1.3_g1698